MKTIEVNQKVKGEHGVICDYRHDFFGYFGWPSVARGGDGVLYAVASGLRNAHVGPFGRNVLCVSRDEGKTWTSPRVINDLPIDDRDTGVVWIPNGGRLLISWFTGNILAYDDSFWEKKDGGTTAAYRKGVAWGTAENQSKWFGSWVRISDDGGDVWAPPVRVPVTAPHGPIVLSNGNLLYFGKRFAPEYAGFRAGSGPVSACLSEDRGESWRVLGEVPLYEGTDERNYHEPHVCELSDGTLLGLIRVQNHRGDAPTLEDAGLKAGFSMMQTMSSDGGKTWSRAEPFDFHGSPPHVFVHSSGAIVAVYGFRQEPYGERAMISRDGGRSWKYHYIIRDDGPDGDLGYPASVELADGSILTVYYQKIDAKEEKCSFLWSRWELPKD
jgi:hypothetical protein